MLILQNVELVLSNDAETVAFLYPHNLPALGVIGVNALRAVESQAAFAGLNTLAWGMPRQRWARLNAWRSKPRMVALLLREH